MARMDRPKSVEKYRGTRPSHIDERGSTTTQKINAAGVLRQPLDRSGIEAAQREEPSVAMHIKRFLNIGDKLLPSPVEEVDPADGHRITREYAWREYGPHHPRSPIERIIDWGEDGAPTSYTYVLFEEGANYYNINKKEPPIAIGTANVWHVQRFDRSGSLIEYRPSYNSENAEYHSYIFDPSIGVDHPVAYREIHNFNHVVRECRVQYTHMLDTVDAVHTPSGTDTPVKILPYILSFEMLEYNDEGEIKQRIAGKINNDGSIDLAPLVTRGASTDAAEQVRKMLKELNSWHWSINFDDINLHKLWPSFVQE